MIFRFFQAGPVKSVRIPVDKDTKRQKNFCFIQFVHEETVPYAVELLRDVKLFGRALKMQNRETGVGMGGGRGESF